MSYAKVSVIILNWNGGDDTTECLESVSQLDYPNLDVIVVDNGSRDGSVTAIRNGFPQVVVLETGENLGFAGGNNVGMRYALRNGAEYVLLLNNDTVVDKQLLRSFMNSLTLVENGGIFGAKIYYYDVPNKIWFAGATWIDRLCSFDHVGQNRIDEEKNFGTPMETDYACGCALFTSAHILRKIGLFDERFFLTFEETDFCYRARRLGYKSFVVPDARVWHKVSMSFGGENSPLFQYFLTRNKLLWAKKHLPFSKRLALYRKVSYDLLKFYLPPRFNLKHRGEENVPLGIYGSLIEYKKNYKNIFTNKFNSPAKKAKLWAVRDYLLQRSGNCPAEVRSLGR